MNKNNPSQKNNDNLDSVLQQLSDAPQPGVVQKSFKATMDMVTKLPAHRIQKGAQNEFTFINSYIMHNIKKSVGLSATAFAIVLMVGYFTFFNESTSEYEDIFTAALDEEESYVLAFNEDDDFSDLVEEDLRIDLEANTPVAPSIPAPSPADTSAQDIENILVALDTLFAEDDIDDSEIEELFADTSADDILTQTYDI